jgi:hypothetical protein
VVGRREKRKFEVWHSRRGREFSESLPEGLVEEVLRRYVRGLSKSLREGLVEITEQRRDEAV